MQPPKPTIKDENAWNQLIKLAPSSGVSLQIQIRRAFVAAILDKRLLPGAALPSSRVLATHLNIARNTVNAAYRQLIEDGFISALPRSGYRVASATNEAAEKSKKISTPEEGPRWSARIGSRYSTMRNISKPSDWHRYPYNFIYGQPDPSLFPINNWRECSRAALAVLAIRDWTVDMIDGDDVEFIEQLQRRVLPRRGIFAATDQIMITVGTQNALYILTELLISSRSVVGVEDPGYPDARNLFELRGAAIQPLPVGPEGVEVADIKGCDVVYLTPSHQCPSAVTMSLARRQALLDAAVQNDTLIIEDDYDSEVTFAENALPALKSFDSTGNIIYLGSLSKTLAPGLRLGFMVGSADLIAEARVLRRLMLRHPPANNQRAAALFISLGHYDTLLRRTKKSLAERANILTDAIKTYIPSLKFQPIQGGSSAWIKGEDQLDTSRLAQAAQAQGILIEPGELFFHRPQSPCPYFRLGLSSIKVEAIAEGIKRFSKLFDRI